MEELLFSAALRFCLQVKGPHLLEMYTEMLTDEMMLWLGFSHNKRGRAMAGRGCKD